MSAHRRLWSDLGDAQADLCLRWAYTHFVGFVMSRLIFQRSQMSAMYGMKIFFKKEFLQYTGRSVSYFSCISYTCTCKVTCHFQMACHFHIGYEFLTCQPYLTGIDRIKIWHVTSWHHCDAYMPYLTLWDKIPQNWAHLEANSHKIFQMSQKFPTILQHILWRNKHKSCFGVFISSFLHLNYILTILGKLQSDFCKNLTEFYQISL